MDKDVYNKFRRLDASLKHNEDFIQDLSSYVAQIEDSLNEKYRDFSETINLFFKQTQEQLGELEDRLEELEKCELRDKKSTE